MLSSNREILKSLLLNSRADEYDAFLKYLEEGDRKILGNIQSAESDFTLSLDPLDEIFQKIHYSWFIPSIQKFPTEVIPFVLCNFSKQQIESLSKSIKGSLKKKTASDLFSRFCFHWFLKEIGLDQLPPLCLLPKTNCHFLLDRPKDFLVKLIHHLGIYELANITRRVVDKNVLVQIDKFLSKSQLQTYKEAKKNNEPKASSTKDLKKMIEDKQSLFNFIERRGILRLAKALAGQHCYLVWYVGHILDSGRGKELLSHVRIQVPSPHTTFFVKQMIEADQALGGKT